jgi:hypothetical protein
MLGLGHLLGDLATSSTVTTSGCRIIVVQSQVVLSPRWNAVQHDRLHQLGGPGTTPELPCPSTSDLRHQPERPR